jgi:hypothetical protein
VCQSALLQSQSRIRKEHHHFGGARAVTGCWFSTHPNIDNPPILNINFGARAARIIIILVEPEPETQQDAAQAPAPTAPAPTAPAPTAPALTFPAPNLMFNIGGLSKMSYT